VEREEGNVLYFNKQFIRVVLLEDFRDHALEEVRILAEPTFLVPALWRDSLVERGIEALLRTEVQTATSRWLLVGSPEAREIVGVPADTLQDGRGVDGEEVLKGNLSALKRGSLALVFLGAYSLGRAGQRHFEMRTGRRVHHVLPY